MTISPEQRATIARMEEQIRSAAAHVNNSVVSRKQHPSFGYTKTQIRLDLARMEGVIGLYMVLTNQATHTQVTSYAQFSDPGTAEAVDRARAAVRRTLRRDHDH